MRDIGKAAFAAAELDVHSAPHTNELPDEVDTVVDEPATQPVIATARHRPTSGGRFEVQLEVPQVPLRPCDGSFA